MKLAFFTRLVLLNTFKKRLRASLVIGGIAITSSVMIVLFGVGTGMRALANNEIGKADSKGVVTVDERNVAQIRLDQPHLSQIQSIAGVGDVESSVGLAGNVAYHGISVDMPTYGITKSYFAVSHAQFDAGDGDNLIGNNVVVSTKALQAWSLNSTNAIGRQLSATVTIPVAYDSQLKTDSTTTQMQTFTIAGVVDKGQLPVAYFPLDGLRSQGVDSVAEAKVRLTDPGREAEVRESIEQLGFQTSSISDTIAQINKIFSVIHKTLIIFAVIVLFITISGTFTIISLTLMEEMRQIGFLRVSGLKNADVRLLFVGQSVILTSLGALAGIVAGTVGGEIVNRLAQNAAQGEPFSGTVSIFAVPSPQIIAVLVLSVIIGWLVGLFPARRAVLMNPLEELRQ